MRTLIANCGWMASLTMDSDFVIAIYFVAAPSDLLRVPLLIPEPEPRLSERASAVSDVMSVSIALSGQK